MTARAARLRYPASAHKCLLRRIGGGCRFTTIASSTASSMVMSFTLAAVTMNDNGTPRPSTSRWRLLPFFSPIGRVRPDRFLRQWRLEHGPVDALPSPGDALHLVVLCESGLPERFEHARLLPLQEAFVHGARAAESFLGQGFPLATRAKHVHHRLEDLARRLGRAPRTRLANVLLVCRSRA